MLEGRITASQPWKILGSTDYRLGRDQTTQVRVVFAPESQREYSGKLIFSHEARSSVELSGNGIPPFEFNPSGEIELALRDGSTVRSGGVAIRNRTSRDRVLEVSAPSEIVLPIKSPLPREKRRKLLCTLSGFLGPLEGVDSSRARDFARFPCGFLPSRPFCGSNPRRSRVWEY